MNEEILIKLLKQALSLLEKKQVQETNIKIHKWTPADIKIVYCKKCNTFRTWESDKKHTLKRIMIIMKSCNCYNKRENHHAM